MQKIPEPGTNCKRIFKCRFSNFTASPFTEKGRHGYIGEQEYFIALIIKNILLIKGR